MKKATHKAVCLLTILMLTASVGWAQISTGSLSGTVTDPGGLVIAGAKSRLLMFQQTGTLRP